MRPRIALITNHGYAGAEIPLGGAPDTGGQNFYVNSLAVTLEKLGFETTIFARGGFPFFGQNRMREGSERLSEHIRYIYVPGGGDTFIRKEDISIALDEQTVWLHDFIATESQIAGVKPWDYFEIVNTHYWDAAVIAVKLVERWRNQAVLEFLSETADGDFGPYLERFAGNELHRLGLYRNLDFHLGQMFRTGSAPVETMRLGKELRLRLTVKGIHLDTLVEQTDNHVWTPHSLGIIKEANFWNKDKELLRTLKFRERNAFEEFVCSHTKMFCSTSPDIYRALLSYHRVQSGGIFDFPPCINPEIFRPRKENELDEAYLYLSSQSGIPVDRLKNAKIVFETSRMDKTKRKDLLLKAFAEAAVKRNDTYLFIGGGPAACPLFDELEKLIAELPTLKGRAFLLGHIPDGIVEQLFSLSELFVSCSEMEGFGMSVAQAAASGTAVVASDLTPFAAVFAKDAAASVHAGDIGGFAAAMERLLSDDAERGKKARELFEIARQFDWESTAKKFIEWFREKRLQRKD